MPDAPSGELTTSVVRGPEALRPHVEAWQALADHSELPNPFYEPWMLLPAMAHLPGGRDVECLLVHRGGELVGLLPVYWEYRCKGIPWPVLSLWQHPYCFLCTPLLKRGLAREVVGAALAALRSLAGSFAVLRFPLLDRDGPTARTLSGAGGPGGLFLEGYLPRPLLKASGCPEAYLERAISRRSRKRLRRQQDGLGRRGEVRFETLRPDDQPGPWLEAFLRLEASGWKGRQGTALACDPPGRSFFQEAANWGHQLGKLAMTALRAGDSLVAMDCNLRSREGLYAFKAAYDEEFADYSPGVLLEVQTVRHAHEWGDVQWVDSCVAGPGSPLGRLYREQREVVTYLAPTDGWASRLFMAALPTLQGIAGWLRGQEAPLGQLLPGFACWAGQACSPEALTAL